MTVIITDTGFAADDWTHGFVAEYDTEAANDITSLDVASDTDPATLKGFVETAQMIRVDFPAASDGRGFTCMF